jgi:hypothetical protein
MKRALLLAAMIAGSTGTAVNADPLFSIQQTSPSVLQFTGTGTAQFNSSKGTNNQFNVGSSTNLGVNANISSTSGIDPSANANLSLATGSTLTQTIGTSSMAANNIASQTAAYNQAYSAANSSSFGSSYSAGWGADWKSKNAQRDGEDTAAYNVRAEGAWKVGWESEYKQAYSAASTNTQSQESGKSANGVIKGTFTTQENGTSSAASSSSASSWADSAQVKVAQTFGVGWGDKDTVHGGVKYETEAEYKAARSSAFESAYNNARASSGFNSVSTVEVQGIGSAATIAAANTSAFKVDLLGDPALAKSATETANGSAGASLSTSSYATQNSSSTASGFMQAFGASLAN